MRYRLSFMLCALTMVPGCDRSPGDGPRLDPAKRSVIAARGLDFQRAEAGLAVYEKHCLACHGKDGVGQAGDWRVKRADGMYPPPPLDDSAHAWHHPTQVLRKAIEQGSPPGVGDMPAWKGRLQDQEIDDVIVYIKSLWSDEIYGRWLEIERHAGE
jgi:mono/diheme cytochrome c family protein